MKIILSRRYPIPYPSNLSVLSHDMLAVQAASQSLEIKGVITFEWKRTILIEFASEEHADVVRQITGWAYFKDDLQTTRLNNILEVKTSCIEAIPLPPAWLEGNGKFGWCGMHIVNDE
jgi:hypothetical protein